MRALFNDDVLLSKVALSCEYKMVLYINVIIDSVWP